MKEDVGMSKPKKHANKVGRLTLKFFFIILVSIVFFSEWCE